MAIPRGRRAYNRVSEEEEPPVHHPVDDDDDAVSVETPTPAAAAVTALLDDDEHDQDTRSTTPTTTTTLDETTTTTSDNRLLTVIILDPAQTRFSVSIPATATIADLKQEGTKVHKVASQSQRLIYRGRLLTDNDTLKDVGIIESDTILHLFPKPRVIVQSSLSNVSSSQRGASERNDANDDEASSSNTTSNNNATSSSPAAGGGAHVTQIILDPDEAERRSSILVLGSDEVMEAQNNVKLLSFLLLIICSMELLALFTIFLGVPQDEDSSSDNSSNSNSSDHFHNHTTPPDNNDFFHNDDDDFGGLTPHYNEEPAMRTWQTSDYFDLAISSLGFYVATLGIKATTENTLRLARRYLWGTVLVGICWNAFYYVMNVQAERKADEERVARNDDDFPPLPDTDFYVQAMLAILLPAIVWGLCCVRAWQFQSLLLEAEEEAEERIRNEISDLEQGGATIVVNASSSGGRASRTGGDAAAPSDGVEGDGGDHELTLQNESATIT